MSGIKDIMLKRQDQVMHGAAAILAVTNDWQCIKEYLCNRLQEDQLSDIQKKKMERYQFMYSHSSKGKYSTQDVISMSMRFFGIGKSQAYEDWSCMNEIFVFVLAVNKRFEIKMQYEAAKLAIAKYTEVGDYKAAEIARKNAGMYLSMMPEEESNIAELFTGHTIQAMYDPRKLGAAPVDYKALAKAINDKRKVPIDLSKIEEAEVIDGDN
jgi:hypothetical protein